MFPGGVGQGAQRPLCTVSLRLLYYSNISAVSTVYLPNLHLVQFGGAYMYLNNKNHYFNNLVGEIGKNLNDQEFIFSGMQKIVLVPKVTLHDKNSDIS